MELKDNLAINLLADYFDVKWIHGVLPEMYDNLNYVTSIEDLINCMKLSAILMPEEINYGSEEWRFDINSETAQQIANYITSNHKLVLLDLSCCKFDDHGKVIIQKAILAARKKQPEFEVRLKID